MMHEFGYHDASTFLTLTYETVPENGSLDVRELQLFFKRLRKWSDVPLRYYAAGEYGENNGRPHYHAIVFGLANDAEGGRPKGPVSMKVASLWGNGFVHFGTVTYDSVRYTCEYLQKDDRLVPEGCKPPFSVKSLGIGRQYAVDHAEDLARDLGVPFRGSHVALPRYYRMVVEKVLSCDLGPELASRAVEMAEEGRSRHLWEHVRMHNPRRQREKNLAGRAARHVKGKF